MKLAQSEIAITLFNVCKHCQTESDLDRSLDKLCEIGYRKIQVSAVALDASIIARQLKKHDLKCCATHEGIALLGDENPEALVERLQTLNCSFTALGYPPEEFHSHSGMEKLAAIFNRQAEILEKYNIRIGYHNHDFEFEHFDGGKPILETLYDNTGSKVCAELDVHWITRGGGNPEMWIRRMKNRIPVIHLKDFVVLDKQPVFCEVGCGNLDWKGILRACKDAGVESFVVEQDLPFPGRDVFESAKLSFDYLSTLEW